MDIITGIVLFVAGVFATQILEYFGIEFFKGTSEKYKKLQKENRLKLLLSPNLNDWIIDYYKKTKNEEILYEAQIGDTKKKIPFITKANWFGKFYRKNGTLKLTNPLIKSKIRIDKKFIEKRKSHGHDLWDAPLFGLFEINESEKKVELKIGLSSYFQYISTCGKIGEESINGIKKLRTKYLPNIETISKCPLGSHGIGIAFLIAIKENNTYKVLLQKRGMTSVNHLGTIATVPIFAFQPIKEDYENEFNIEYQFLREYYEELHDREELIKRNKKLAFNWFYNHSPVKRLRDLISNKKLEIAPLGFGFDALNGEAILAYIAIIDDANFWQGEKKEIVFNWEIENIMDKSINGSYLENLLNEGNFHYGSMFAISEGLKYLKNRRKKKVK